MYLCKLLCCFSYWYVVACSLGSLSYFVTQITGNLPGWLLIKQAETGSQPKLLFTCISEYKNKYLS